MNGENWVKARRDDCSLGQVFKDLERGVRRDVDAANESSEGQPHKFKVSSEEGHFSVTRSSSTAMPLSVEFCLKRDEIEIGAGGEPEFVITLTLNNEGRPVLKANGKELELWQVRKMALEELFFGKGGSPMPDARRGV
ncbi:MAG: hypothetical protein WCC92_05485 [Candidatus Korobacteraceae bacterium]